MDKIIIKDLVIFAKHGVLPEENVLGQKFLISLILQCDLRAAGLSDDLKHTLSYADVAKETAAFLTENTLDLLEACAEKLARHLLLMYPIVKTLTVTIQKPWAPIGLDIGNVMVEITRSRHQAFIALGSNMGDKQAYLEQAVQVLDNHPDCRVITVSPFITTAPYGGVEQDDFLNGVLELQTLLEPLELLELLQAIENQADRKRTIHWGPRTLDLDLLFYDDLVMHCEKLTLPHPDIANRTFVLEPMCAIAPYHFHPTLHMTMRELLRRLQNSESKL